MRKLTWWGKFLVLLVLNLILAGPVGAKISPEDDPVAFTDYGQCLGELQAAGAFKFYDNTEAILRLAQFEQALMRYRFLKGHIQGKVDYYGLLAMVNLRLQFLKKQLHLRDTEVAAIPPRKVRIPKAKPAEKLPETKPPEKKPAAAKPKTPGDDDTEEAKTKEMPGATVTPRPPGQVPAAAPLPGAQKPPPVVTSDAKTEEDKEESKPAVPPNFWQRLKLRLHLGKQPGSVEVE